jgi:hypothetical protein
MTVDGAMALVFALCEALTGHVEHRKLIDQIEEAFRGTDQ